MAKKDENPTLTEDQDSGSQGYTDLGNDDMSDDSVVSHEITRKPSDQKEDPGLIEEEDEDLEMTM